MRISDWSSDVCSSDLIARLERGADSPANWLCSIGLDTARDKAEPVSDGGQRCGKTFSGVRTANLGGWSDRDVEHDMGSTRRNLLRQDRSDQLSLGVDVERALHADEDVIGRTQADRPAPGQASAFGGHHALHGLEVKVDPGEDRKSIRLNSSH